MNSQIIRIAENGHEFFLQYPEAVAGLKIVADGQKIPEIFHGTHNRLVKEHSEHVSARTGEQEAKQTLRRLSKSLRLTAYALERGVNSVLDLEGRGDEDVDFVAGTDFNRGAEQFIVQLTSIKDIVDANPTYQRGFARFQQEFAEYQQAAGQIGRSKSATDKEKQDLENILDYYEPIIAALHSLIKRYLGKTDTALLKTYKQGLRNKSSGGQKTADQTAGNAPAVEAAQ